jgi:hypothetical protein
MPKREYTMYVGEYELLTGRLIFEMPRINWKMLGPISPVNELVFRSTQDKVLARHGIHWGHDEEGYYVLVGMNLPEGVLAEIDDGTYGTLQGLKYYYSREEA